MVVGMSRILCIGLAYLALHVFRVDAAAPPDSQCRVLPGDSLWPHIDAWKQLNTTVGGRLITTIPLGHVCHDPTYNETACAALEAGWSLPQMQWPTPEGFTAGYQQEASCNPYTPRESPCLQGNYVYYAINVSSAEDAAVGVKFAQENNIRLVIKNTGHDYLGKSTGKGALSVWTHHLKNIEFLDYTSAAWTGQAVKLAAGVQGFEANNAAAERGLTIVGGECLTVGIVGGFSQGGGHSLLSSRYGLGADQALEWEVVTAGGAVVTATPTENSDLYWALSGGGAGTYGVVISLTVKAYPDTVMAGATGGFSSQTLSADVYYGAIEVWHTVLPALVDAGAHVTWIIQRAFFTLYEISIPRGTEAELRELVKPWTDWLTEKQVPYQLNFTELPTYHTHIEKYLGPPPYGYDAVSSIVEGGVMLNRSTVAAHSKDIVAHIRNITTTTDFFFPAYAFNVSKSPSSPNAAIPAWRDMLIYLESQQFWNFTIPYETMAQQADILTNEVMPPLQALSNGAYMNEADFQNPNWKKDYYGSSYEKLKEIKKKYDPNDLFYATTAVGSDAWEMVEDGRLCRT